MLSAKQIETMITDALKSTPRLAITRVAEKIAALIADDGATVAAAMLENEVTSTLMDMTVATVLATLIEEEGGGRANVSISPMSMDHMLKHYEHIVTTDGMIRNVAIQMREDSDLKNEIAWREPSNRHGVMHQDEDQTGAKPQAEERVYDRPVWAVRVSVEGEPSTLMSCANRADAEAVMRTTGKAYSMASVENRYCLHAGCPSTGCTEATSKSPGDLAKEAECPRCHRSNVTKCGKPNGYCWRCDDETSYDYLKPRDAE
jgi:hypothetical protein